MVYILPSTPLSATDQVSPNRASVPDLVVHPAVAVSGVEQLSAATFTVSSPLPVEVMTALESARIPASGP